VTYALFTDDVHRSLLDGRERQRPYGLSASRARDLEQLIRDLPALDAVSLLELSSFIEERLLRDTDCASMAVSLEARVPLLDHVVIEAAAGLDPARRFQPLGRKALLREIALAKLDPAIFDRPKSGFVLPIEKWSRELVKSEVARTLADGALCAQAGIAPAAVARLWCAFEAGAPGMYWSRIWSLYVLLWWCREHRVSV
jgi:asparagine synthase (glutamine-hydrolysing)